MAIIIGALKTKKSKNSMIKSYNIYSKKSDKKFVYLPIEKLFLESSDHIISSLWILRLRKLYN